MGNRLNRTRRVIAAVMFVALPLAAALTRAQAPPTYVPRPGASGLDLGAMNRSANACTDFYEFACGAKTARPSAIVSRSPPTA